MTRDKRMISGRVPRIVAIFINLPFSHPRLPETQLRLLLNSQQAAFESLLAPGV